MEIKVRVTGAVIVLDLYGTIDVNSASLVETIGQCVRDGYADILCNFEGVNAIDYMGISVIAIAYKEIINNNGRMKFANIPPHLKNLFLITGLDKSIETYTSEDLAINSFKEDKIIEDIKKMQLRRRFKRLPIDIKIELKAKYEKSPACFRVDILNLSAVGAFVYGCSKFKLGDDVILKLKNFPKLETIELEAKVVWLCDKQIQPQLYPGMGVAFHNIQPAIQEKLLVYIERNLSLLSPEE
jgi:anti-anti-sigma factor